MPNPKPKLENLKPFKPKGDKPFAKSYAVRWPEEIWQQLEPMPDKSEFIRRAVRRELMNDAQAGLDTPHRGCGTNETPSIELSPILKDLEAAFNSGKTLKPTDIKQLLERLRSINMS